MIIPFEYNLDIDVSETYYHILNVFNILVPCVIVTS